MEKPKISFVVTARNDNYGGNLLNRASTFIRVLSELADKYHLPSEIIMVDYNPIPGKKFLFEEVPVPITPYISLRGIVVPKEFHDRIRGNNNTPLIEYVAKNIGIRRARGDYIIATNPDILFSEPLITFLAQKDSLREDTFYRITRYDLLVRTFNENLSLKQIFKICERKQEKVMYNKRVIYRSYLSWFNRFIRSRNKKTMRMFPLLEYVVNKKDPSIYDMAAGDFLLAHRSVWDTATGYDETPLCSYMDGYILHVMKCLGYKQEVLDFPIYHINHDIGSIGRPKVTPEEYRANVEKMEETGIPYRLNSKDWGYVHEPFQEILIK